MDAQLCIDRLANVLVFRLLRDVSVSEIIEARRAFEQTLERGDLRPDMARLFDLREGTLRGLTHDDIMLAARSMTGTGAAPNALRALVAGPAERLPRAARALGRRVPLAIPQPPEGADRLADGTGWGPGGRSPRSSSTRRGTVVTGAFAIPAYG